MKLILLVLTFCDIYILVPYKIIFGRRCVYNKRYLVMASKGYGLCAIVTVDLCVVVTCVTYFNNNIVDE